MKAAVWTGPKTLELHDLPVPEPGPDQVRIRVAATGLCGTDVMILHGLHPRAQAPLVLGHEFCGWIDGGPDHGTLVAVEPLLECGKCRACRSGVPNVCRSAGVYGIDAPGSLAEYVVVDRRRAIRAPAGARPELLALTEPFAVAYHAVQRTAVTSDEVVAIYGGGPVGMLLALVARYAGARTVVIAEPNASRREVGESLGFTMMSSAEALAACVAEETGGDGADVTFDAAAHASVTLELARVTRAHGRIGLVGIHKTPPEVDLQTVCYREQTLFGNRTYTTEHFTTALELAGSGAIDLAGLPTSQFALDDIEAAFEEAVSGEHGLKALVMSS